MMTRKLGILVLALGLGGVGTLPISAQNNADNRDGITTRTVNDGGFDMGWLGLLGLAGLMGLRRRDDSHNTIKAARTM